MGDYQVRFRERFRVKLPLPTRRKLSNLHTPAKIPARILKILIQNLPHPFQLMLNAIGGIGIFYGLQL